MFGGFVEAIFVILEEVRELQKLVFAVFEVSRPARPEASLERGVDLSQDDQRHKAQNGQLWRTFSISSTGVYLGSAMAVCDVDEITRLQ